MISPRLTRLSIHDAADLLQWLYRTNVRQLEAGAPGIIEGLTNGTLRYIRSDPGEDWLTIKQIWARGGGDCEDLAAAAAAELTVRGMPSKPVVYRVRRGLSHAVVVRLDTLQVLDPSILGGMNAP